MANKIFYGYSTIDKDHKENSLSDVALIKRDLLNHFHTRKGERVMLPEFGSIIWDMIFEPLTQGNKELIIDDVKKVIYADGRLDVISVSVLPFEHGFQISASVYYAPLDVYDTFSASFDQRLTDRS